MTLEERYEQMMGRVWPTEWVTVDGAVILDPDRGLNLISPVCGWCERLTDPNRHTCTAFPKGIPFAIWQGTCDHDTPFEGDGGNVRVDGKPEWLMRYETMSDSERVAYTDEIIKEAAASEAALKR